MTKPTESLASQMNRMDHAIKLEFAKINKDCLEAIVEADWRVHRARESA